MSKGSGFMTSPPPKEGGQEVWQRYVHKFELLCSRRRIEQLLRKRRRERCRGAWERFARHCLDLRRPHLNHITIVRNRVLTMVHDLGEDFVGKRVPLHEHPVYSGLFMEGRLRDDWERLLRILELFFGRCCDFIFEIVSPEVSGKWQVRPLPMKEPLLKFNQGKEVTVPIFNIEGRVARYGGFGGACVAGGDRRDPDMTSKNFEVTGPKGPLQVRVQLGILQWHPRTRRETHGCIPTGAMVDWLKFTIDISTEPGAQYPYVVSVSCPKGIMMMNPGVHLCDKMVPVADLLAKCNDNIVYLMSRKRLYPDAQDLNAECNASIQEMSHVIRKLREKAHKLIMKKECQFREREKVALVSVCPNPECPEHHNAVPIPAQDLGLQVAPSMVRTVSWWAEISTQHGQHAVALLQNVTCLHCATKEVADGCETMVPTQFCSLCSQKHFDGKCPIRRRYTEEEESAFLEEAATSENHSYCPWCWEKDDELILATRRDGCPKLTCTVCSKAFCSVCNGKLFPGSNYVDQHLMTNRRFNYVCRQTFLLACILNRGDADMPYIICSLLFAREGHSLVLSNQVKSTLAAIMERITKKIEMGTDSEEDARISIGVRALMGICNVCQFRDASQWADLLHHPTVARKVVDIIEDYRAKEKPSSELSSVKFMEEFQDFKRQVDSLAEAADAEEDTAAEAEEDAAAEAAA